ncbi:hypothetical protein LACWKB10_1478 [Lactobacillus sp. wkB10]|nr:hypothetical protein LACWKB10_1478 [Lactobacillus sp. wkB10]
MGKVRLSYLNNKLLLFFNMIMNRPGIITLCEMPGLFDCNISSLGGNHAKI